MQEIWAIVKDNTNYEVSNYGKVRNLRTNYILKPMVTKKGYHRVDLGYKTYSIHRLVAQAFIENPNNKPQVNHIDCDKSNNRVDNLEWCTNGENQIHAINNNLKTIYNGVNVVNHKINDSIAINIFNSDKPQRVIAKEFNISQRLVLNIKKKRAWIHIHSV
jgi:hypothetical protein